MQFRPIEPWMKKGATIQMPNNTGVLMSFVTTTLGKSTGYKEDGPVMLSCNVQLKGVKKSFPFNPWDMSPVIPKGPLPFPEHIG